MPHWRAKQQDESLVDTVEDNPELAIAEMLMRKAFFDGVILGALGSVAILIVGLLVVWLLK